MKLILSICLSLVVAQVASAHGGMSTGGGAGIACLDSNGILVRAETLDLYEGKNRFGYSIQQTDSVEATQQFKKALNKIQNNFLREKLNEVSYLLIDQIQLLPDGIVMPAPADMGNTYLALMPQGCSVTALAYFEGDGTLRVAKSYYSKLSQTDRAALIMHEAVYKLLRDTGKETTSESTRLIVAMLFSTGAAAEATQKLLSLTYTTFPDAAMRHFAVLENEASFSLQAQISFPAARPDKTVAFGVECLNAAGETYDPSCIGMQNYKFYQAASAITLNQYVSSQADSVHIGAAAFPNPGDSSGVMAIADVLMNGVSVFKVQFEINMYIIPLSIYIARKKADAIIPVIY